ncbi:hypothetical protein AOLI_G00122710 [Acnodon oligacanthus]
MEVHGSSPGSQFLTLVTADAVKRAVPLSAARVRALHYSLPARAESCCWLLRSRCCANIQVSSQHSACAQVSPRATQTHGARLKHEPTEQHAGHRLHSSLQRTVNLLQQLMRPLIEALAVDKQVAIRASINSPLWPDGGSENHHEARKPDHFSTTADGGPVWKIVNRSTIGLGAGSF